jgi:dipeptidyl-peptidase-4
MKRLMILTVFWTMGLLTLQAGEPLKITDVTKGTFRAERISGINPIVGSNEYAQISLDGRRIEKYSFKTGKMTGVLFDIDKLGDGGVPIEEFDDYELSADGQTLLIQTNTQSIYRRSFTAEYYIYKVKDKTLCPLSPNGPQQVPTFSPDGKQIAFVRANNIFITDGQTERQITTDGVFNEVINGIPDWVNEEEFSFNNAMAWSADSHTISWIRYDETNVKTYALQLFKGDTPSYDELTDYPGEYAYKYPKAGQDNAVVSAWSYDVKSGTTRKYDLPLDADGYIPRIKTTQQPDQIVLYTMNRHQDTLRLYAATPSTGKCRLLIEEKSNGYVKEEAMEHIIVGKNLILLPSDRDGYMHLYLYDFNGKMIRQVEQGDYDVTDVYGFDERTGNIFYQSASPTPMNREVYQVDKNGNQSLLTPRKGWNSAVFSGDYAYFVNTWSDRQTPYVYTVCNQSGKRLRTIIDNQEIKEKILSADIPQKDFFQFTTGEGHTLNGWMMKPVDFDSHRKYPVIMFQYGGPGNQQVIDSWNIGSMGNGGLYDAYLTQRGFIVVCVDGRGTGGRGTAFEKCTYLRLGDLESKDQVETALWLGRQPYVDADRIGIWGWSFGGFNTLMSMSEGRPVFRAGVAVAPPTNWKYYDSIYSERYMRTPQENPDGYAVNPIQRADQLHGALLICHGTADDNVHPQNTYEYVEALVQADKDFKENLYTNRNHSIYGGNTRTHLLRQIAQFFEQELK